MDEVEVDRRWRSTSRLALENLPPTELAADSAGSLGEL